eukprot:scaffold21393_cov122-Isochrysis_galbana.AAC.4
MPASPAPAPAAAAALPLSSACFRVSPSWGDIIKDGSTTSPPASAVSDIEKGQTPPVCTTMQASAPAACTRRTLSTNEQPPRQLTTSRPRHSAALCSSDAASGGSAKMRAPVTPEAKSASSNEPAAPDSPPSSLKAPEEASASAHPAPVPPSPPPAEPLASSPCCSAAARSASVRLARASAADAAAWRASCRRVTRSSTCGSIRTVGSSSSVASSAGLASVCAVPTRSSSRSGWIMRWSSAGTSAPSISAPLPSPRAPAFSVSVMSDMLDAAAAPPRPRVDAPQCGQDRAAGSGPKPHSSQTTALCCSVRM